MPSTNQNAVQNTQNSLPPANRVPAVKPSQISVPSCQITVTPGEGGDEGGVLNTNHPPSRFISGALTPPPQFKMTLPGQESPSSGHSPKISVMSEPPSPKPINKQLSALVMTKEFKRDLSGGSRSPSDDQMGFLGATLGMQCVGHNASSLSLLVQYSSSEEDDLDLDDLDNIDLDESEFNGVSRCTIGSDNDTPDREFENVHISDDKWAVTRDNKKVAMDARDDLISSMTSAQNADTALDKLMTVLIRLRLAIGRLVTRGLFPYNAEPLVKLLEQAEKLYES